MNPLANRQVEFNRATLDGWRTFAAHRDRVMEILCAGSDPARSRLCVLGAGNCNDLDLPRLLRSYREIHLVDLDADALARGIARQHLADTPAVKSYGGVDVTGVLGVLAATAPDGEMGAALLDALVAEPVRQVGSILPGPFDVVASTCLLSQLIGTLAETVGETHPQFPEMMQAIRTGHLRLLAHLIAPGGAGALITDFVSSDSHPPLRTVPEESLFGVIAQLISERNFFHGVNPAVLLSLFRSDPVLAREIAGVEAGRPWRWDLGPRVYAVCALTARKRGDFSSGRSSEPE